jgi:hypothetical protein
VIGMSDRDADPAGPVTSTELYELADKIERLPLAHNHDPEKPFEIRSELAATVRLRARELSTDRRQNARAAEHQRLTTNGRIEGRNTPVELRRRRTRG